MIFSTWVLVIVSQTGRNKNVHSPVTKQLLQEWHRWWQNIWLQCGYISLEQSVAIEPLSMDVNLTVCNSKLLNYSTSLYYLRVYYLYKQRGTENWILDQTSVDNNNYYAGPKFMTATQSPFLCWSLGIEMTIVLYVTLL